MTLSEYIDLMSNYYWIGAPISLLFYSTLWAYIRPKDMAILDIALCFLIVILSGLWMIYGPMVLAILVVYGWIRLVSWSLRRNK